MSKMKMPEMSVVRFNVNDLIVASSGYYTVHNSNNSKGYDLRITNPSDRTIYLNTNSGPSVNDMSAYGGLQTYFRYSLNNNPITLSTMTENDSREEPILSGVDGDYIWNPEENLFLKYGLQ